MALDCGGLWEDMKRNGVRWAMNIAALVCFVLLINEIKDVEKGDPADAKRFDNTTMPASDGTRCVLATPRTISGASTWELIWAAAFFHGIALLTDLAYGASSTREGSTKDKDNDPALSGSTEEVAQYLQVLSRVRWVSALVPFVLMAVANYALHLCFATESGKFIGSLSGWSLFTLVFLFLSLSTKAIVNFVTGLYSKVEEVWSKMKDDRQVSESANKIAEWVCLLAVTIISTVTVFGLGATDYENFVECGDVEQTLLNPLTLMLIVVLFSWLALMMEVSSQTDDTESVAAQINDGLQLIARFVIIGALLKTWAAGHMCGTELNMWDFYNPIIMLVLTFLQAYFRTFDVSMQTWLGLLDKNPPADGAISYLNKERVRYGHRSAVVAPLRLRVIGEERS